ncbi:MAG: hypothetical protein V9G08_07960 [Dermatophilaceae bacterium]
MRTPIVSLLATLAFAVAMVVADVAAVQPRPVGQVSPAGTVGPATGQQYQP